MIPMKMTIKDGRRRGLAVLLGMALAVTTFAAFGTPLVSYGSDGSSDVTYVSVGLKYGNEAVERCELRSDDGFQIVNISGGCEFGFVIEYFGFSIYGN